MPPIAGRQKRAPKAPPLLLQSRVDPELRARVYAAAEAVGLSISAYVEQALAHAHEHVDEDGRPEWWPDKADPKQEELPLTKAS
jgi:hypothetical protein